MKAILIILAIIICLCVSNVIKTEVNNLVNEQFDMIESYIETEESE